MMSVVELSSSQHEFINQEKTVTDHLFDNAVDEAVNIIAGANQEKIPKIREEAVDAFFASLYNSLGAIDSAVLREEIQKRVPVIAMADDDGFYINYNEVQTDDEGYSFLERKWSDKIEFTYDDGIFQYSFSLGDAVKLRDYRRLVTSEDEDMELIVNLRGNDFSDLRVRAGAHGNVIPDNAAYLSADFSGLIQNTIATTLENSMNRYCNLNNEIVKLSGTEYRFALPEYDGTAYVRALTNRGVMALFCDYPMTGVSGGSFNRYSISNGQTRIKE